MFATHKVEGEKPVKYDLLLTGGDTITVRRRLLAQQTIKDGRVWYERPAE